MTTAGANHTLTRTPVTTLFDFYPLEAHRVGGIIVVSHVCRTPDGQERRTFAALGTVMGDEVKLVDDAARRRAMQKNATRRRARAKARAQEQRR